MNKRTIEDLKIEQVYYAAACFAQTEVGAKLCLSRGPMKDPQEIKRQLGFVEDALFLLKEGYSFDLSGYFDWEVVLKRAVKHGILTAQELISIARLMDGLNGVRDVILAGRLRAPRLYEEFGWLPDLSATQRLIQDTFDEKGLIRDDASPRLGALRKKVKSIRDQIHSRLDGILKETHVKAALQDEFVTLREGRYVVPVQVSHSPEVPGIIHAMSNTGQTAFVEPKEIVQLNNTLIMAQEEVRLEELRVLKSRTRALLRVIDDVKMGFGAIKEIDWIFARGRLAIKMNAHIPLIQKGNLRLKEARHPLLVLSALDEKDKEVVPNDILIPEGKQVIVISGPNAGGKSITLQTVGLICLMAYSGYLVPAQEGSLIPVYDEIFTLMGDVSTLKEEVSTFTGQLERVKEVFEAAGKGKILALLDEVATGTEPKKGQALAAAIVKKLADKGVDVIVSTHYDLLKRIAQEDERFINASMEIGPQRRPTYKLVIGRAGESNPFEAAKEVDFPEDVLELARSFVSEKELKLDEALARVTALKDALDKEKAEVERLKASLQQLQERYFKELERVRSRADVLVAQARQEALNEVRRVKKEILTIEREVKTMGGIKRRRKRLSEVEEKLVEQIEAEKKKSRKVEFDEIREGDEVVIRGMKHSGVVVSKDEKKKKIEVVVQGMKLWVDPDRIEGMPQKEIVEEKGESRGEGERQEKEQARHVEFDEPVDMAVDAVVEVRGMRVDEALSKVEQAIDEAYAKESPYLVIKHGIGTSALKKAVREYLRTCGYPVRFRGGLPEEGGEVVTVVFFE